ncbi:LarC family nickel insertion protein [Desulfovibrio mangrovi]|uniref:LarC family nickel insertion protein n=1 Tax=Desulfovibrio mangrovi TaxID=2976983 RepID=UPI002246E8BE|nr:LarC family nickel insertion protein [Desulfovibrio mangrovi]UZP67260.1 LarC family nickel insertion protein [Desulfovibrio mangrovi]
MRSLYLDCSLGLGGDMLLAALHGLGADFAVLEGLFSDSGVAVEIRPETVTRQGVAGCSMSIRWEDGQPLRHLADLEDILNRLAVSPSVKEKSAKALRRLAEVEATVHGVAVESVHFHEVGAIDTLVDVVGAFWALEQMGVEEVVCSSLPWFTGTVQCEHGTMALPAPATLQLMQGKPVHPTAFTQEMVTPTGALLIDALVSRFAEGPTGTLLGSGLGYGTRDSGGGLRTFLLAQADAGKSNRAGAAEAVTLDTVVQLESNVDHLTGEEIGFCFESLMEAGALDVLYLPGIMKKNRAGGVLRVLCAPDMADAVQQAFFHHTHTLGIRRSRVERVTLQRHASRMETPLGEMEAKSYSLGGRQISRPEYEALVAFARKTGRSLPELRAMMSGGAGEEASDGDEDCNM